MEAAEAARPPSAIEGARLAPGDDCADRASAAARANAECDDASNGVSNSSKRTPTSALGADTADTSAERAALAGRTPLRGGGGGARSLGRGRREAAANAEHSTPSDRASSKSSELEAARDGESAANGRPQLSEASDDALLGAETAPDRRGAAVPPDGSEAADAAGRLRGPPGADHAPRSGSTPAGAVGSSAPGDVCLAGVWNDSNSTSEMDTSSSSERSESAREDARSASDPARSEIDRPSMPMRPDSDDRPSALTRADGARAPPNPRASGAEGGSMAAAAKAERSPDPGSSESEMECDIRAGRCGDEAAPDRSDVVERPATGVGLAGAADVCAEGEGRGSRSTAGLERGPGRARVEAASEPPTARVRAAPSSALLHPPPASSSPQSDSAEGSRRGGGGAASAPTTPTAGARRDPRAPLAVSPAPAQESSSGSANDTCASFFAPAGESELERRAASESATSTPGGLASPRRRRGDAPGEEGDRASGCARGESTTRGDPSLAATTAGRPPRPGTSAPTPPSRRGDAQQPVGSSSPRPARSEAHETNEVPEGAVALRGVANDDDDSVESDPPASSAAGGGEPPVGGGGEAAEAEEGGGGSASGVAARGKGETAKPTGEDSPRKVAEEVPDGCRESAAVETNEGRCAPAVEANEGRRGPAAEANEGRREPAAETDEGRRDAAVERDPGASPGSAEVAETNAELSEPEADRDG